MCGKVVRVPSRCINFSPSLTSCAWARCYIAQWLQKDKPDNYTSVNINFSAQTHVNQLQDNLDSRMEKRRRGVFGPPAGKQIAIFIDDLNMPQKEPRIRPARELPPISSQNPAEPAMNDISAE